MSNTPVPSLSGKYVTLETCLYLNPVLQMQRCMILNRGEEGWGNTADHTVFPPIVGMHLPMKQTLRVPEGQRCGGATSDAYNSYRSGLVSACADIVITTTVPATKTPKGVVTPAVLAVKRKDNVCFGGNWWMQGGAIHNYRPVLEFLEELAEKECGVKPMVEALIGIFRTTAPDIVADTIQPCFVGHVPYEKLGGKFKPDASHDDCRLLTLEDLSALPENEKHDYPMFCFAIALETEPTRGFCGTW